jgi:NarL family two-component system response regulator LiaR
VDSKPIRTLIVDDHPIVREGIRVVLSAEPGIEIVGEAGSGDAAIDLARRVPSDVLLMDLMMPGVDGVEATRRIVSEGNPTRIVVLTNYGGDEKLFPALEAGACGFLLKDSTPDDLIRAIRQVAAGQSSLSPPIARRLVREVAHEHPPRIEPEVLTTRETEVLRVMALGLSNEQIGERLFISPATVRTHISSILSKLNLARRTQAVRYALRHGIANLYEELEQGRGR